MKLRRWIYPLLFAGICGASLKAAEVSPITPYVDEQTVVAARIDVSRIDTVALEAFVGKLMDAQQVDKNDAMRQGMMMGRLAADGMLARFKALGGDRVYVLMSAPDMWPAMQPVAILIPIGAGGDMQGMEAFVNALPLRDIYQGGPPGALQVKAIRGDMLCIASAGAMKRLETIHAQPRPELEAALSGGAGVLTVVATPTPDMRRVVTEMMPRLPQEFGGAETGAVAKNLVAVTLQVKLPPEPEFTVSANTGISEEAAGTIGNLANRGIDALRADPEFKREFGPGGGHAGMNAQANAVLDGLKPAVMNVMIGGQAMNSVTIHLSADQMQTAAMLATPSFTRAKAQAGFVRSASNLKQIGLASLTYYEEKKKWPASFDDLKPYIHDEQLLINPNDPQHRRYAFEGWTTEEFQRFNAATPSIVPVAYEAGDDPSAQVNVLYMDGHVERLASRKMLTEQLAKCHAGTKK